MNDRIPILDQCVLSDNTSRDITIQRLASYLERNKDLVFPHRHNFYHFVFFTKGTGSHSIDFERFTVEPWQVYFMSPGQIHTWAFEEDVDGYVVNFEEDVFQTFLLRSDYISELRVFSSILKDSVLLVDPDLQPICVKTLDEALKQYEKVDFVKVSVLYFLSLIQTQFYHTKNNHTTMGYNSTLLNNFRLLIERNYKELRLPKDYAELLYITPNHLNALSKEFLGISAGEIIRDRVILEAKRLLAIGEYSISEIAYTLNFTDNSYFTKFFKKAEGITPEEFKRKLQQQDK